MAQVTPVIPTKSSGISQKEKELQEQVNQLVEQNRQVMAENYIQSLTEDKIFRVELLQVLTRIQTALETINNTAIEISSQGSEESEPEQTNG